MSTLPEKAATSRPSPLLATEHTPEVDVIDGPASLNCAGCQRAIGKLDGAHRREGEMVCDACFRRIVAYERVAKIVPFMKTLLWAWCGLIGGAGILMVFVKGGPWVYENVCPWAALGAGLALLFLVPASLVCLAVRPLRLYGAMGLIAYSYLLGLSVWLYALATVCIKWGVCMMVAGVFMLGIGVVPMAFIACLFDGMWSFAFGLVGLCALVYACRVAGHFILSKWQWM